MISIAVYLCRGSTEILLRRSEEDNILNVTTNIIVMIVLLEYSGTLITENTVSFSLSKITFKKTNYLVTSCKRWIGEEIDNL